MKELPKIEPALNVGQCNAEFPFWGDSCWQEDGSVCFLNERRKVDLSKSWEAGADALWMYNLHYFDDLCSKNALKNRDFYERLIDSWIENNRDVASIAWDSYPASLRIVNWCKYFWAIGDIRPLWIESLAAQASVLVKKPEYHLMGNHLYANAKALVFAGVFLGGELGEGLLSMGLKILKKENREQFLRDGAHFELSPMYHSILLWDVLDLINLLKFSGDDRSKQSLDDLINIASNGLGWMNLMSHPDGDIAFFNDASFGVAPKIPQINAYAQMLGVSSTNSACLEQGGVSHLMDSGYAVVDREPFKAILDVAEIGPKYLPGHAHADTLSFELSISGKRFLVNSGTSRYGQGTEREYQRSTEAHNTVVVGGVNSSEVWGGFRVARRAMPVELGVESSEVGFSKVKCGHNGYMKQGINVVHMREWSFLKDSIEILDVIDGEEGQGVAFFHFHPDCEVDVTAKVCSVSQGDVKCELKFSAHDFFLEKYDWNFGFGVSRDSTRVVVPFSNRLRTVISV